MNESRWARVERLKKDAEAQKPIKAPETEVTEEDSILTNPDPEPSVPEPTTLVSDQMNDPKRPFI
jgi:hypothetical protein